MEHSSRLSRKTIVAAITFALIALLTIAAIYKWKLRQSTSTSSSQSKEGETVTVKAPDPYQLAVQAVEQDRGEPVGNKARIEVPPELKLYKDKRRFIAIQVAEWREQKYAIPHDFAQLASMVRQNEFTRLPLFGTDYILYGVGLKANDELTHYDQRSGKSIPLFESEAAIEEDLRRLDGLIEESGKQIRELKANLSKVEAKDRALRKETLAQISEAEKSARALKTRRDLIDSFYKSAQHRQLMVAEYNELAKLAGDFDGKSYDLKDPDERRAFKMRILSLLRTGADTRLEEISKAYRQKFNRHLPVTSLVRTREYQRYLGEAGNPNAIQIDVPPHTTGLAFDIYTHYMSGEEQQFLMDEIARLERAGQVEALRENRDHIHVFAFADGKPPGEELIRKSLNMKATDANAE